MSKFSQRIRRFVGEEVLPYLRHKDKKRLSMQYSEMKALYKLYNYFPYQYVKHGLYKADFVRDIFNYIPPELLHQYRDNVNPKAVSEIVRNKIIFERLLRLNGVSVVPIWFLVCRDCIADLDGHEKSISDVIDFAKQNDATSLFAKPVTGGSGRGIHKIELDGKGIRFDGEAVEAPALLRRLFRNSIFNDYILQPTIKQHPVIDQLNPICVNSLRIDTLVVDGNVVSNCAFLRLGSGTNFIDNLSLGGYLVSIDLETGELSDYAITKRGSGNNRLDKHTRSGVEFAGIVVPYWQETRELLNRAARAVLPLKFIGWDIAITPDGPTIIEANHDFSAFSCQIAAHGLRDKPVGIEMFGE